MPTGTRSLMLVFPSLEDPAGEAKTGSVIDVIGGPALVPGIVEVPVIVRFGLTRQRSMRRLALRSRSGMAVRSGRAS